MGQKIHPGGLRVGVIHDWKSNWYAGKKEIAGYILEDVKIREHIYKKLAHAGLSDILIRKDKQRITVDIYTARPGIVIGKSGVEVDALRKELHALTQKNVHININEIKRPELDAKLVAQSIAEQLSNRVAFRRAMKRALASAIRSGAAGVKIQCSGRLGGSEMCRREQYSEGRVPLHTIRADIDYGFVEAKTSAGRIGVKVWINKGEIMPEGYEGMQGGDTRLGDQDTRRRRGGATEGLGASRESGRSRGPDREGLGPVRQRRRGPGGPGGAGGGGGGGAVAATVAAAAAAVAAVAPCRRAHARGGGRPGRGAGGGGARPAGGGGAPVADAAQRERREAAHRRQRRVGRGPRAAGDRAAGRDDAEAGCGRAGHDDDDEADRGPSRRRDRSSTKADGDADVDAEEDQVPQGASRPPRGNTKGQTTVQFGDYGLKAIDRGWITNRQIEAARIAMTRKIKRGGKVWINVFPDKSFTKKPAETRMGSGKGSPEGWVAVIKPGRVMFELAGVPEPLAKEALRLAGQKLSVKTKVVKREGELFD